MNFFKRAFCSITRKKGKSFILFAVVFVLGNVIAGAIAIRQATINVEKDIKSKLGATATITTDQKKITKYFSEHPDGKDAEKDLASPKIEEIKKIGELSYVKYYDYNNSGYLTTNNLKSYQSKNSDSGMMNVGKYGFTLKGVNYPKILDLEENKIKLVSGRAFSDENIRSENPEAVISQKVAELNNLAVGDSMTADAVIGSEEYNTTTDLPKETATKDIPIKVIGIYQSVKSNKQNSSKSSENNSMDKYLEEDKINTLYLSNKAVAQIQKTLSEFQQEKFPSTEQGSLRASVSDYYQSYFVLKSPEDVEAFKQEAAPYVKSKYYKVLASADQYDSIAGPVKGMGKIAKYVIIVSVIATIFILALVVLLFLRDRKHELGIYLSLGEKRWKVIGQIVLEVFVVSIVAMTFSVFSGNFLAKGVSDSLVQSQVSTSEKDSSIEDTTEAYEFSQLSNVSLSQKDIAHSYKVSLSPVYIVSYYLVGILTLLLATILPLVYIVRLNPKKIMM